MNFMCLDLINSMWYIQHRKIEPLQDPKWIKTFLLNYDLPDLGMPTPQTVSSLMSLRAVLIKAVEELQQNNEISDNIIESLNNFANFVPYYKFVEKSDGNYKIFCKPAAYNWEWVACQIALSFTDILCNYNPKLIKFCENPDCRFVFYDITKNHSGRWCCNSCGNLMKVRRFRAKNK